ncbi:MAG: hypothetical protein SGI89_15260, partial [bacterium]|nr:hypothetical protein [bacterium]
DIILYLSFAIPILVIIAVIYFVRRGLKKGEAFADKLRLSIAAARPATAMVVSASQGMTGGDINRIIHLKLQVNDGFSPPYIAKTTWFINTLHFDKIREGNAIMIKVDSINRNIIYPAENWGRYSEGYENLKTNAKIYLFMYMYLT